jgi:ComF family protein
MAVLKNGDKEMQRRNRKPAAKPEPAALPRPESARKTAFKRWLLTIQDWLLPRLCVACGLRAMPGRTLCARCAQSLPSIVSACPRCAIPLPGASRVCGRCLKKPPAFTHSVALYRYASPADHLIRLAKFHQQPGQARALGRSLATRVLNESRPDVIVPVPLHAARLRERGYNQALEIARPVARVLNVPLAPRLLTRTRPTPPQAGLDRRTRERNLKNAFVVVDVSQVRGKTVALIDDVMTSGSTAGAAALALKRAGAKSVMVWVVARA